MPKWVQNRATSIDSNATNVGFFCSSERVVNAEVVSSRYSGKRSQASWNSRSSNSRIGMFAE